MYIYPDGKRAEYRYNESLQMDALNRLTKVNKEGELLRSYTYDAFGNRTTKRYISSAGEAVTRYTYNENNQLVSESGITDKRYSYDRRGNMISSISPQSKMMYTFDSANQMSTSIEETDGNVRKATYAYNGLGHRVGQMVSGLSGIQNIEYTLDLTKQYYNLLLLFLFAFAFYPHLSFYYFLVI